MTYANNKTAVLWSSFMPRRKEVKNALTTELISMQVYDTSFDFGNWDPNGVFEKWAAVEVPSYEAVPDEMETYTLPSGLYAVFLYKGSSTDTGIFQYIFEIWLPKSDYTLDSRPHFEVLGAKYKNNDLNSEEEIWIPIKPKHYTGS
jgi:AraC family transcriptional regulator